MWGIISGLKRKGAPEIFGCNGICHCLKTGSAEVLGTQDEIQRFLTDRKKCKPWKTSGSTAFAKSGVSLSTGNGSGGGIVGNQFVAVSGYGFRWNFGSLQLPVKKNSSAASFFAVCKNNVCPCKIWKIPDISGIFFFVRAKPCLPLCSFSLIRKTELWETNKPPAMQVS